MRFRLGITLYGFWKITVLAMPADKVPPIALQFLLAQDGKVVGGAGRIFASVE